MADDSLFSDNEDGTLHGVPTSSKIMKGWCASVILFPEFLSLKMLIFWTCVRCVSVSEDWPAEYVNVVLYIVKIHVLFKLRYLIHINIGLMLHQLKFVLLIFVLISLNAVSTTKLRHYGRHIIKYMCVVKIHSCVSKLN